MSPRAAPLLLALALAACTPRDEQTPAAAALDLDCAKGFAALSTAIAAQPGVVAAPREPGEPYRFYNTEDGRTSYMVTEAGAPGHPAIIRQASGVSDQAIDGCAFGDKAGYDQLTAYLSSLSDARKR